MKNIELLEELKSLTKEDLDVRLKNLTEEEKELLESWEKCESVKWHTYTGYNLYFILTLRWPWIYGTFNQWKEDGRCVRKWSKWTPILTPIFNDKDKTEIRFFKTSYVFHKEDTDLFDNNKIWENK